MAYGPTIEDEKLKNLQQTPSQMQEECFQGTVENIDVFDFDCLNQHK
jgi:hypothetical protein